MLQLNEFVGIEIAEAIEFIPQTWGWWLLLSIMSSLFALYFYMQLRHWWKNRYRKLAVNRIIAAKNKPLPEFSLIVLSEIKQAIALAYGTSTMLKPSSLSLSSSIKGNETTQARSCAASCSLAALNGHTLLVLLDITAEHNTSFNTPLGDAWQLSLLSKTEVKDAITVQKNLTQQACIWLMHHRTTLPCGLAATKESADA